MLAFFERRHMQSLHLAPGTITLSQGLGSRCHIRTQNELTAPAQTLLLPEYQGRSSSFPPVPLFSCSHTLLSTFPHPNSLKSVITQAQDPATLLSLFSLSPPLRGLSSYSVRCRTLQVGQGLRPHFSANIIIIIALVTKNHVVWL